MIKNLRSSYENVIGNLPDGKLIYIDKELIKKINIEGKVIKKRTRTWLVKK